MATTWAGHRPALERTGFGLYRPERLGVNEEGAIGFAVGEGKFANGHSAGCCNVDSIPGLNDPARRGELRIDLLSGFFLGGHSKDCGSPWYPADVAGVFLRREAEVGDVGRACCLKNFTMSSRPAMGKAWPP